MQSVNLSGTNLQNINLTNANIFSTDLSRTGITASQVAQAAMSRQEYWWLDEDSQTWRSQTYYGFGNLNLMGTGITQESLRTALEAADKEVSDLTFRGIKFGD